MAKNYFYNSVSDADLVKELLAGACELEIQRFEYEGLGTLYLHAGNDELVITDTSFSDDDLNSSVADNIHIIDDNGLCARGKVIDTIAETGRTILMIETNDMVLVSDGVTVPTFTDGTEYTVQILSGSNTNLFGDYFGYNDDGVEFDSSPETLPLVIVNIEGQEEEVAEKVTKRILTLVGNTFNVPNSDIISKVMNMEQYGLNNATQKEYHGGFSPNISDFYQITAKLKVWDGENFAVQLFKGQLMANGAMAISGTEWKMVGFQFKGKKDTIRDNVQVNGFRILKWS